MDEHFLVDDLEELVSPQPGSSLAQQVEQELSGETCKGKAPAAAAEEEAEEGRASPRKAQTGRSPGGSEAGDMTCAICLHTIELEELAMIKGCDHVYCAKCILHWALHKENPWCPQCKQPFSFLLTYRALDGTLQDFPTEETVTMLKRALWFEDYVRASEKGKALVEESRLAEEHAWQDYGDEYDLADDEELEAFYFSSAAGRARVVLENRRFGAGGYLSSGRRQARPVPSGPRRGGGKAAKSGEHAVVGTPPAARAQQFATPNAGGGRKARPGAGSSGGTAPGAPSGGGARSVPPRSAPRAAASVPPCAEAGGSSPGGSGALYGSSPSGSGRRARRNAKRQAMDSGVQQLGFAPSAPGLPSHAAPGRREN